MDASSRIITSVVIALFCGPSLANSEKPVSSVEVEVLWTDAYDNKVDLFAVITNPNDFDIYLGRCGGTLVSSETGSIQGFESICTLPLEFRLIPAKGKRLEQVWRGWPLKPGLNHFRVVLPGKMDPHAKLPWNYVVTGKREFQFVVANGDSLKQ